MLGNLFPDSRDLRFSAKLGNKRRLSELCVKCPMIFLEMRWIFTSYELSAFHEIIFEIMKSFMKFFEKFWKEFLNPVVFPAQIPLARS